MSGTSPDELLKEYQAVRLRAGTADISWRGKLKITGTERAKFLHNMLTNDILNLKNGEGIHAGITTAKAKALGDAWVYSLENEHFLFMEPHVVEKILEHLNRHVITADVQIMDVTQDSGMFGIYGPRWKDVLACAGVECPANESLWCKKEMFEDAHTLTFKSKYIGVKGVEILVAKQNAGELWKKLLAADESCGAASVGIQILETIRIESGIPKYGVDFGEDELIMEAGMEDAISYTKGCYLGQETIARVKYQGGVRRTIAGLEVEGEEPVMPGSKIAAPDDKNKEIGTLTSETWSHALQKRIALAMLRKEHAEPGMEVILQSDPERHARIHPLPFTETCMF